MIGRPAAALVAIAALLAIGIHIVGFNPAVAQGPVVVAFRSDVEPSLDATDELWSRVPAVDLALTVQQVTYPVVDRGTPVVTARALHTAERLFVALEWRDATLDDSSRAVDAYPDAAAVEFPAVAAASVPFVCMGQADQAVNIWYWRADDQATVADWRAPIAPDGYVDRYASIDDAYYPARAVGNPVAQLGDARLGWAQNLVSGAFGTLGPVGEQVVRASGTHQAGVWSVVFVRDLVAPGPNQPTFGDGVTSDIAFAVWNGDDDERDGMKSTSQFAVLELAADPVPA